MGVAIVIGLIVAAGVTVYTVVLMWEDLLAAVRSRSASDPSSKSK